MANILISFIISSTLICSLSAADLPCSPRDGDPGQGQICVCNSSYCDTVERPPKLPLGQYHLYTTSKSTPGFTHVTGSFTNAFTEVGDDDITFTINSTIQYQEIKGFGASFTDSAGIVIDSLPPAAQDKLIESYFSTSGLEYSFCRMPIGGSDFSTRRYTLDDVPGDNSLEHFSLQEEDYKYKIRYIKKAQTVCPYKITLLACSWSAPQWMKTNNHMYPSDLSGWLNMEHYRRWADYHVKFIEAYKENGIDIWAVSGGNEPLLPLTCEITLNNTLTMAHQQRVWLKDHLAPALSAANLSHVKYLTMEDTRLYQQYWMSRFAQDPEAYKLVEGLALHWYFDYNAPPTLLDLFHEKFPDKPIYYTESSVNVAYVPTSEAVSLGSWMRGALYMYNIIENLNHWVVSYIDWNLALDPTGGPTLNLPVDASIIVNATSGEFYKNPLFYALGHFSKFIPPGSKRVDIQTNGKGSSSFQEERLKDFVGRVKKRLNWGPFPEPFIPPEVVGVATANSDGSNTVIIMNNKNVTARVRLGIPEAGYISLDLEQYSLNSFVYWLS